ncbi:hypothetical protein EV363DRAFT_1169735, partial [Boletus edulis]
TFGKQHRSCKHPIHIPLVEWHCGKRTCHVRLVICVELQQGSIVVLRFLSSPSRSHIPDSISFLSICQRICLCSILVSISLYIRSLVSLVYFPIFGICSNYLFTSHFESPLRVGKQLGPVRFESLNTHPRLCLLPPSTT